MKPDNGDTKMPEISMAGPRPFPPRVSGFTATFWQALGEGRLITTRCGQCSRWSFPPRNLCRQCWNRDVDWVALRTTGSLYSFTRVHVVPGAFRTDAPYAIGIVDLADKVRLMCRLVGDVQVGDLDQPIEMVVLRYNDGPLFGARVLPSGLGIQNARAGDDSDCGGAECDATAERPESGTLSGARPGVAETMRKAQKL